VRADGGVRVQPAKPAAAGVRWHVVAGSFYDDPLGGAFWEGLPNDGMVSLASAMSFLALCPDSVSCEALVLPIKHPDWNWGENLLESPRVIDWVLDRILADLERDSGLPGPETPAGPVSSASPPKPIGLADR